MKKYPITYKGKRYEVRWYKTCCLNYIAIYEERNILGIKYFKNVYEVYEDCLKIYLDHIGINENNSNYYIEEVNAIFKRWEAHLKFKKEEEILKESKKKALKEWNGVIE